MKHAKDKPVGFCPDHLKKLRAENRAGARWTDNQPICPDCEWAAGNVSAWDDALMLVRFYAKGETLKKLEALFEKNGSHFTEKSTPPSGPGE